MSEDKRIDLIRTAIYSAMIGETGQQMAHKALDELAHDQEQLITSALRHRQEAFEREVKYTAENIRLRKENDAAGELIVELAHAHLEAEQRCEMLEEVLKRIANDSRPCLWDADHAAEHWKHVASQRREWAIEALHHISLEDTNESVRCNVEKDNGRVTSNRDEDYCTFIVHHDGPHSWEKNGVST